MAEMRGGAVLEKQVEGEEERKQDADQVEIPQREESIHPEEVKMVGVGGSLSRGEE